MKRTDIPHSDVFFSWTGADRAMKNEIVAYLRKNNIRCTESDDACSGNFQQWSREAVSKSTVFLLLYTENTPKSKYVPVEIEAFMELEDHYNRCVPVVTNFDLYAKNLPTLADRESAVILNENGLTEKKLEEILRKVRSLICNRLFAIYRLATAPTYLRFESLLREMRLTEEFEHAKLYINRSVTDEDGQTISDAAAFCKTQDIIYLYGPAGSGKTCYIDQLRNAADEGTLVLTLPCRELLNTKNLLEEMYAEFHRYCGNHDYFSLANFQSLLSVKHLLLVLDGLDEIGTKEGKEALFGAVRDYYATNSGSTTLFITSRGRADADMWKMNGQIPKVMRLRSLEEDQIKDFGTNLFLLLGSPDKSEGFYIRIHDLAEEIRTNPLLLSQLAIIYNVKNEIPQTVVGIYDAVCEIMVDKVKPGKEISVAFDEKIFQKLPTILKRFSAERYRLLSQGKVKTAEQIFKKILRDHGCDPDDAPALIHYLQDRAILVGNEFYHKMLLEYFTAVYYYEQCFDDYDELENQDVLSELFDHYNDPYWSAVLQLFLIKADSCADADTTADLYRALLTLEITDFTLLFDACQKLLRHKEAAQKALLTDILERSATGAYPPYGPLFWYVPEYDLYGVLLSALTSLQEAPCFTKALALTRDVCWIFGKYHTAEEANDRIDGKGLLSKAALSGVRKGLCELFYQGSTDCADGNDIYPRCFNVAEAVRWKEEGLGIYGRMGTAFEDALGLYSHEMLQPFGGEWVGIVSMGYDVQRIEEILPSRSCRKLCGLFLSSTENAKMQRLAINDKHLRVIYIPENIQSTPEARAVGPFAYPGIFADDNGFMYYHKTMILPDGVTEIVSHAFANCSSLTSITIPEGVTEIGSYAFMGCSSLTSITIPDGVTQIGDFSFQGCSSLTSATIPAGVTEIGYRAFSGCSSLTSISIPEGVTKIGRSAFSRCSSLASINIPKGVTEIGGFVFQGCISLTSITIPDGVTQIGDSSFQDCSSLTSVTIPDSVIKIGHGAFYGCSSLPFIVIPDGVTEIGWSAFSGCSSLTSITNIDSVTKIKESAFSGCSSLTSITNLEGLTEIGDYAFCGCSSLASITIPAGVTEIGDFAFSGCSSLTSINIPEGIKKIGKNTFRGCTALMRFFNCPTFYDRKFWGVSEDCVIEYCEKQLQEIVFHSEAEILQEEFADRKDITSIVIPEGITIIGDSAFSGCSSLTSISIPEGVTKIGWHAFSRCSSLASINIPDTATEIGSYAFEGCSSLASIKIPKGVIEIGDGAFDGCCSLTSVTLSKSVTKIKNSTFHDCTSLASITLLKGVTEIGDFAFSGCSSLTSITIPDGVIEIGLAAFSGCSSLASIKIPKGITNIVPGAFCGCSSLTSIVIPDGVTEISGCAFSDCSSLTSISIPEGVTKIGWHAFSRCSSLASIKIPDTVTEIEFSAFFGCSSLASIVIPKAVRFIGDGAFAGCTGLREITISRRFEDDLPRIFKDVDLSEVKIIWQ